MHCGCIFQGISSNLLLAACLVSIDHLLYNPDHKIDLKFMLAEQKERNPRAKFTRAKTLGYFYESQQIRKRIESYKYQMSHRPTARIIRTTAEKFQQSQGLTNWVTPHSVGRCHKVTEGTGDRWEDRENMKAASKEETRQSEDTFPIYGKRTSCQEKEKSA